MDAGAERRRHPRLYKPFSVTVRGVDASGKSFETNTALDNMSAGGLHMQLERSVRRGAKLFMIVQLSTTQTGRGLRAISGCLSGRRTGYVVRALRWVVRLFTRIDLLAPLLSRTESRPHIAIRGIVIRTELKPNGMYGVAVKFTHSRFL